MQVEREVSLPYLFTTMMVVRVMTAMEKILLMLKFTCSHLWHTSMATPNKI